MLTWICIKLINNINSKILLFILAGTVIGVTGLSVFKRDFLSNASNTLAVKENTPSENSEHQIPQAENSTGVSESIKHTANLKSANAQINNSAPIAGSNTEFYKNDATPKTFEELAEAYNASFKTLERRPTLAAFDEHARERLNKIIANGAGCNHETNKQECEKIFNSLKIQADLGDTKAIRQYGISKLNESAGALYDSSSSENELRRKYNEGKDYLLKIGPQLSVEDTIALGSMGQRFESQEEALAWILIAKRLGDDIPLSLQCRLDHLRCTPEQFLKAKDIADAYVDLYQIDK